MCTLGAIGAISSINFEWLTLTMTPDGESVTLGSLTGGELDSRSSAIALFLLACAVVLWLVRGTAARLIAGIGILGAVGLVLVTVDFLLNPMAHDASGRIATLTNVAEAHDVSSITPSSSTWPYATAGFGLAMIWGAAAVLLRAQDWPSRVSEANSPANPGHTAAAEADATADPIALWDSQRDN
ncbi:MAG: hypothetical protein RL645_926 [Actinomycetota bacterium]